MHNALGEIELISNVPSNLWTPGNFATFLVPGSFFIRVSFHDQGPQNVSKHNFSFAKLQYLMKLRKHFHSNYFQGLLCNVSRFQPQFPNSITTSFFGQKRIVKKSLSARAEKRKWDSEMSNMRFWNENENWFLIRGDFLTPILSFAPIKTDAF